LRDPRSSDHERCYGERHDLIADYNWSKSPLGSQESWPQPLKTLVELMLSSNQQMFIAWGEDRTLLYNDA
jgi:hypothetical protein